MKSIIKPFAVRGTRPSRFGALWLALFLGAFTIVPAATAQVGGAGVVFLKIEPDSRSAGMGNAGVALADNASAIFWNPAGLAFQTGTEAGITHSNWLPEFDVGLFYEYLVAKHHVPGWGTFGAHVTYLNLGEHEGRDEQNLPTGTFKSYDLALGASYGFKVSERFALGTSLRFIYSNLAPGQTVGSQETKAGVSTAFDIAGLYRSPQFTLGSVPTTLSAGFNLANMGPKIQYSDSEQADPIPTNLRFGTALTFDFDEFNSLNFVLDFNKDLIDRDSTGSASWYKAIFSSWKSIDINLNTSDPTDVERVGVFRQITIGGGLEYWYNKLFALRTGYFYEDPYNGNRKFLTLGAGIRYNIIGVDFSYIYALEEDSPLANTMRFSLLLNFAG
ncbi:MAG: type IX secretion system outer membrane channel protein PorV [Rhodothermales bacterium]|nr:type IX secretion system outer membrane channel protein PorV [Rhodothermales bacterium]